MRQEQTSPIHELNSTAEPCQTACYAFVGSKDNSRTKSKHIWMALVVALALTIACVGFAAPTTSPNALGTIVAATMLAITPAASATTVASTSAFPIATNVPTLPSVGPTPLPATTRINFLTNATTGVVRAPIQPGQSVNYALQASQAQPMIIRADSLNSDVTISLRTQGGTWLLNPAAHLASWQGVLPQTEDYYIGVYGGTSTEDFTLTIEIAARIKFAAGTYSEKVNGQTVAGYSVAYTIFAIKGQKMIVDLYGVGSDAALTIYGFNDDQPYLRSMTQHTSFTFRLPSTQDYIVEVVPRAGKFLNYTLVAKVQ